MSYVRTSLLVVAALGLGGCQQAAVVRISNVSTASVTIEATLENGSPICVENLAISLHNSIVWGVGRRPGARCLSSIEFPKIPEGYDQVIEGGGATQLTAGAEYEIDVSGDGADGSLKLVPK